MDCDASDIPIFLFIALLLGKESRHALLDNVFVGIGCTRLTFQVDCSNNHPRMQAPQGAFHHPRPLLQVDSPHELMDLEVIQLSHLQPG